MAALFAVVNPFGNVPVFLALTEGAGPADRLLVARRASLVALGAGMVFAVAGPFLLAFFGITLAAFRVAGGIILFGIAASLLHAQGSPLHTPRAEEHDPGAPRPWPDIAVAPLAVPILAGPGTLATLLVLGQGAGDGPLPALAAVLLAFLAVMAATYAILVNAERVGNRLSRSSLNLITRMMGLLLAVIAVQMAAAGLLRLFPAWGRA
ncbi:MAG: MarC family protein [Firmicutes bacterium]|nr:MarC family protein [Bacillota bacterium]